MPLYTFKCEKGHTFDQIVPTDTKKTGCPECGKGRCLTVAKRTDEPELPARRNPAYGIVR